MSRAVRGVALTVLRVLFRIATCFSRAWHTRGVSLKRKLGVGFGTLLIAAGTTGAGLAASGHGRSLQAAGRVHLVSTTRASFFQASAEYLGTSVARLRHEEKAKKKTLAEIANTTPGRSAKQLTRALAAAAALKLQQMSDHVLSRMQARVMHAWLVRRITGFLNDTCPLGIAGGGLQGHLLGCAHMQSR